MSRKVLAAAAAASLLVLTTSAILLSGTRGAAAAAQKQAASTAAIQERSLSATVSVAGILTYRARPDGLPYSVIDQAQGTYTELPGLGQVIGQGHALYRVDDRPVVLLRGATPAYRTLSQGAIGPDVAELNADLAVLGYASRARHSPATDVFGGATATAVGKLQAAVGMPRTGALALGQAVFEPTAVRVTDVLAQLGGRSQRGQTVMQATSTARQVQVALGASQRTEVAVGNQVTITLPDNRTTPGVVSAVGTVATCASGPASGGSGSSPSSAGAGTCASGGSQNSAPTISVAVIPSARAATGTWDQAPVQVGITTARVPHALVVPVNALLARSGGGYAVEVAGAGGRRRVVPVSLGMFDDADGLVQISGPGVAVGDQVVVPTT